MEGELGNEARESTDSLTKCVAIHTDIILHREELHLLSTLLGVSCEQNLMRADKYYHGTIFIWDRKLQ